MATWQVVLSVVLVCVAYAHLDGRIDKLRDRVHFLEEKMEELGIEDVNWNFDREDDEPRS